MDRQTGRALLELIDEYRVARDGEDFIAATTLTGEAIPVGRSVDDVVDDFLILLTRVLDSIPTSPVAPKTIRP